MESAIGAALPKGILPYAPVKDVIRTATGLSA
jgi:hypothetical protein